MNRKSKMAMIAVVVAAVCLFTVPAFSAVGIVEDNTLRVTATDIKFAGSPGNVDGSRYTFPMMLSGVYDDGSTSVGSSSSISDIGYSLIWKDIPAGSQSNALPAGSPGQILTIQIGADSGGTFILTPATATGFTRLVFNDNKDLATLLYVDDTVGWIILSTVSVTVE